MYYGDEMDARWGDLDAPVKCPNGHPTGRQNPEYAGHGEGIPFATGWFTCEVCRERYNPKEQNNG